MPKATVKLASGAVINIEGSASEVKELLAVYAEGNDRKQSPAKNPGSGSSSPKAPTQGDKKELSLTEVVEYIKDCDEADDIESRILDKPSQVNRILLPLFITHKYMDAKHGLTTGDISTITRELGIPIHIANVSNTLKGSAARYVIGDTVRRKGQAVRYKLSRRGVKYIEQVIKGKSDGQ